MDNFFPGYNGFWPGNVIYRCATYSNGNGFCSNHFSGTASGVNNAITRISNVFANAIFGALAVIFFSQALQSGIKNIQLPTQLKQTVIAQAVNLGNAKLPANINDNSKLLIEKSYHESFISAYRKIMQLCAMLAFLGALMSFLFIKNSAVKKT